MPNPYHDADGKFCSRNEMKADIDKAGSEGNFEVYTRLRSDLEQADATPIQELSYFVQTMSDTNIPPFTQEELKALAERQIVPAAYKDTFEFVANTHSYLESTAELRSVFSHNGRYYRTGNVFKDSWDEVTDSNPRLTEVFPEEEFDYEIITSRVPDEVREINPAQLPSSFVVNVKADENGLTEYAFKHEGVLYNSMGRVDSWDGFSLFGTPVEIKEIEPKIVYKSAEELKPF